MPDDDAIVVKKMLEYFYLLDYESDKESGLCIVETDRASHSAATDLAIDEVEDPHVRDNIMRLQDWLPHHGVRACLEALTQNNLNYNHTLHELISQDANDRAIEAKFGQFKKSTESPSM